MVDDVYLFKLNGEEFDRILSGKKSIQLAIANPKRKVIAVGNQIEFRKIGEDGQVDQNLMPIKAHVDNLMFFGDLKEAIETLGKEKCGYSSSATFDKASDKFLSKEKYEEIQKYGIMALIFSILK